MNIVCFQFTLSLNWRLDDVVTFPLASSKYFLKDTCLGVWLQYKQAVIIKSYFWCISPHFHRKDVNLRVISKSTLPQRCSRGFLNWEDSCLLGSTIQCFSKVCCCIADYQWCVIYMCVYIYEKITFTVVFSPRSII